MKQNDLKEKSGNLKLMDLIPGRYGYDVSKVYEGISAIIRWLSRVLLKLYSARLKILNRLRRF